MRTGFGRSVWGRGRADAGFFFRGLAVGRWGRFAPARLSIMFAAMAVDRAMVMGESDRMRQWGRMGWRRRRAGARPTSRGDTWPGGPSVPAPAQCWLTTPEASCACRHAHMMIRPSDRQPRATRRKSPATPGMGDAREPLQVRIPTAVKRRFKAHAALRGLQPHQVFVEMWHHYVAARAKVTQESPGE